MQTLLAKSSERSVFAVMRDDSMLFSLKRLQEAEAVRAEEEAAQRTRRIERAERGQLLEQQRREEAERRRAAAEHEAERLTKERLRAEAARLDAMSQAVLVRSRRETELAHEASREEARRQHELELRRLEEAGGARRWRLLTVATSGTALSLLGAALGIYFGEIRPESEELLAATRAALGAEEESATLAARLLETERARVKGLEHDLQRRTRERDEARTAAQAAPSEPAPRGRATGRPGKPRAATPAPMKKCSNDDPMNFCL